MAMNPGADMPTPGPDPGDDERLPCGRLLSEVWDAGESGTEDPHMASCPHCGEALRQLTRLGEVVRAAGGTGSTDPDASTLADRVMDVVRLELRPGRPLPLGEPDEDLWVLEATAARTLRAAADALPGVRAGSCRIAPAGTGRQDGPGRGPVSVRLEVVTPWTADLQALADEIRRRVHAAADLALGMPVAAIDVTITDITDITGIAGVDDSTYSTGIDGIDKIHEIHGSAATDAPPAPATGDRGRTEDAGEEES
ncbi:Asp23/Gls24 family envelope stress response protein [Streptomyces sp. NPDC020917]|uniref:Asp23/Gls24 family envelope stress response protein n=1 Tax=Streptomyces sp. NPDC020917 TaxID=3365102 RepID=UPI0037ABF180